MVTEILATANVFMVMIVARIACLLPLFVFGLAMAVFADGPQNRAQHTDKTVKANESAPPELTLESLYHPQKRHDYDGSTPPTHWVQSPDVTLLIQQDQSWNQVDLETGQTSPWGVTAQLANRLQQLDGVKDDAAKAAALRAVTTLSHATDTVLVRIGKSLAVCSTAAPARWLTRDASTWQNPTIDPTFRRVAYTRDGDLFLLDIATSRTLRLTSDASETLLDGILDWTYQEEIFGRGNYRGFWFSHDGQWLAMLRIDISGIEPYFLSSARDPRGRGIVRRYPKAGDPIPHASLVLWDLRDVEAGLASDQRQIAVSRTIAQSTPQQERIVTGLWWDPRRSELLYAISDRLQTWRELWRVDPKVPSDQPRGQLVLREESPAWVEPPTAPKFKADGSFYWLSALPTGRQRLYHVSADGQVVTPVSPDQFDVAEFEVFEQTGGSDRVFVAGDAQQGTVQRHVYRASAKLDGRYGLDAITEETGWHQSTFSPDGQWFVDRYSTPNEPTDVWVRSTRTGSSLRLVDATLDLELKTPPQIIRIATPDGILLPGMLIRPSGADSRAKCPVVVEVYGGPRAPIVSARWGGTRSLYRELLARRGIATLVVDNRSSAGRGIADTWPIRGRVGELEFNDVMHAVDWLRTQDWVDPNALAMRGWSFGGFLTLYTMTHSDAFAAGIAGGSVTEWAEYDAFYTERYMGLPAENPDGYRKTSPLLAADKMNGLVLMIHGELDDNVHPVGTLRMAEALQKAGKPFRLMIYPGAAHGVHDRRQLWHMNQMIDAFLVETLARAASTP